MLLASLQHRLILAASLSLTIVAGGALIACSNVTNKSSDAADSGGARPNTAGGQGDAADGDKDDGDGDGDGDGDDGGSTVKTGGSKPPSRIDGPIATKPPAQGAACTTNDDCGAEQVCEGQGCDAGQGVCQPKQRMCTRDLKTYCGCDGKTFQNSGSCPGARYSAEGACAPQ